MRENLVKRATVPALETRCKDIAQCPGRFSPLPVVNPEPTGF